MKFAINKALLPLKGYYFLLMSAQAAIFPYLPIFAKSIGLTTEEVALVYGIFPVLIIITNPLFGAIADKFQSHKLTLIILILVQIGFALPIYYLPPIKFDNTLRVSLECNSSGLYLTNPSAKNIDNETQSSNTTCNFSCELANENENILKMEEINFFKALYHKENISEERITFRPLHFIFGFTYNKFDFDKSHYIESEKCTNAFHGICTPSDCNKDIPEENQRKEHDGILITYQFLLFLFCRIILEICNAAGNGMGDAITLEKLKDKPNHFGKTRLMGSLGFGIASVIFGRLNDVFSETKHKKDYGIGFYSFAVLYVLSFLLLGIFAQATIPPKSRNILKDIKKLFQIPQITAFVFMIFFDGMTHTFIGTFNFWYLQELGASHLNMGLSIFIMCMSEAPFFYFSGNVIKKIGHNNVLYVVFATWSLRLLFYSVITNPWLFLPNEILHGICFALFYANMTSFAKKVAFPGTLATIQEIFGATFQGVGSALGSLLGGLAYHKYGAVKTYRGFSIGMITACVAYLVFNIILNKTKWRTYLERPEDSSLPYDMKNVNGYVENSSPSSSSSSSSASIRHEEQINKLLEDKENEAVDELPV